MDVILSAALGKVLGRAMALSDLHFLKFALSAVWRVDCREAVAKAMEAWGRWCWGQKRSVWFGLCLELGEVKDWLLGNGEAN